MPLQIFAPDLGVFITTVVVLLASLVAFAGIGIWDRYVAKDVGSHVKSAKRDLLLASEVPPCRPVPKEVAARDPFNAKYDIEFSYPESCPPVEKKAA